MGALRVIWQAAGYPWSARLRALLPLWVPSARRRLSLSAETEARLRRMSPRQMDRVLRGDKAQLRKRLYGRTKPGTLLKHHIPLWTDRWDVTEPGWSEIDLVSHSGDCADGEFAYTPRARRDAGPGRVRSISRGAASMVNRQARR